jgi:hypothetical protein
LPAYGSLDDEIRAVLAGRFGVSDETLLPLLFEERGEEVWVSTILFPPDLYLARPLGVRAFRRGPSGLKPTSTFLVRLGQEIRSARVEIAEVSLLRHLLLGQEMPCDLPPGFVALSFRGDVLGCGEARGGRLRTLLPTGRRKELLDLLDTPAV